MLAGWQLSPDGAWAHRTTWSLARVYSEYSLDFDCNASGQRDEAHRRTDVAAKAVFAENRVNQVRGSVDHQMMVGELRR